MHYLLLKWNKEVKVCHVKDEAKLSRFMHAIQSLVCAWFFFKLFIFCAIWHPIFPNIKPHYETEKLNKFDRWYAILNWKLKRSCFEFKVPNPFNVQKLKMLAKL